MGNGFAQGFIGRHVEPKGSGTPEIRVLRERLTYAAVEVRARNRAVEIAQLTLMGIRVALRHSCAPACGGLPAVGD